MSERFFLNLEAGTGKFFEYSKTVKDGFVKVENVNPTTKAVAVSFRRYFDNGVFGNLVGLSKRERDMGVNKVMEMSIVLENPEKKETYFCNFPLFSAKGSVNDYSMSVIRAIKSLEKDKAYCFKPYAVENEYNGKVRKNYGISIFVARLFDDAIDTVNRLPLLTFESQTKDGVHKEGDIPMLEWGTDFKGATIADSKKRDAYLWSVLEENSIVYEYKGNGVNSFDSTKEVSIDEPKKAIQPNTNFDNAKTTTTVTNTPAPVVAEDDDDLPF